VVRPHPFLKGRDLVDPPAMFGMCRNVLLNKFEQLGVGIPAGDRLDCR
jgi:hypothetical protein